MTPHHLHATAAAWSLQAARGHLANLADEEAAQIAAEALEAPALLRSPVWGGRHGSGGHGDPTPGMLAVDDRPERRNRWAEMAERVDQKLTWLADQLPGPAMTDPSWGPIQRLILTVPFLQPGTAAAITRHLLAEEKWVREAIQVDRPWEPVPGSPACPACRVRCQLRVQTAGPQDAWTVVCAGRWEDGHHNLCLCVGQGCGCGMPGAVEGVAHIWPRAAVITGAVAGAAPTTTRED